MVHLREIELELGLVLHHLCLQALLPRNDLHGENAVLVLDVAELGDHGLERRIFIQNHLKRRADPSWLNDALQYVQSPTSPMYLTNDSLQSHTRQPEKKFTKIH